MFSSLQIGPFTIPVDGLLLVAGLWLGLELAERTARHTMPKHERRPDVLYTLVFIAILTGFLGARLVYVGRYLDSYLADPRAAFSLNINTLDSGGGLLFSLAGALVYGRWRRLPLRSTLDTFTPGLAVFAVAVGLAHLASGDAFGGPTTLPWAIELWDARRHPSQVYEIIAAAAVFIFVWRLRKDRPFPGFLFLMWVALTSGARLFLEAFRGDSIIVAGGIRQAQLAALLVMLASQWFLGRWAREKPDIGDSHQPA